MEHEQLVIDQTGGSARLLRVPGTINSKGDKPVRLLQCDEDRRYSVAQIEEFTANVKLRNSRSDADTGNLNFTLDPDCKAPKKLGKLKRSETFRELYNHERCDWGNDQSRYDFNIGLYAAGKGWSNQEIVDLLVVNRREHGDGVKTHRADYYQRTLESIRTKIAEDEQRRKQGYDAYVYVHAIKRFVHRKTMLSSDKEQFENRFASELRAFDAAEQFLLRKDTEKVETETFLAGQAQIVEEDGLKKLNRWRPPDIEPIEGDVGLFLEHVDYLYDSDPDAIKHTLDFMAHLVQFPDLKIRSVLLLIGMEGLGKDALGKTMRRVLGMHNTVEIENEEIKGAYNEWMANTSLVVVSELMTQGRLAIMNTLKPYITNDSFRLNRKFMPCVTMPTRANFMLFSNYTDAARLQKGDRRYFVHICQASPRNETYYNRLWAFINSDESIAALQYYLLNRDISAFNPNAHAPMTASKELVIEEGRSALELKLYDHLEAECSPFDKDLVIVQNVVNSIDFMLWRQSITVTPHKVSKFLRDIGARDLGQKRIEKCGKRRVWAIRNHDAWGQASEARISEHLLHPGQAKAPTRSPQGSMMSDEEIECLYIGIAPGPDCKADAQAE